MIPTVVAIRDFSSTYVVRSISYIMHVEYLNFLQKYLFRLSLTL